MWAALCTTCSVGVDHTLHVPLMFSLKAEANRFLTVVLYFFYYALATLLSDEAEKKTIHVLRKQPQHRE